MTANLPPIWAEPLALGFSVFPCQYLTKKPLIKWQPFNTERATPEQLSIWAAGQANVATACGPLSGVWVIDTDGPDAEAALLALGDLPATLSVKTPRGRHRYFRYPAGTHVGNRAKLSGVLGLDARGHGGYVMSPGSFFWPGAEEIAEGKVPGSYQWECAPTPDAILDAPEWLLALVTRSNEPTTYGDLAAPAVATVTSDYGRRALTAECNTLRAAQPGERNDQLNRSAFAIAQLVAGGDIVAEEAAHSLREAAAECGLDHEEIEHTLASGWKSGSKQPRKGVSISAAEAFGAAAPALPAGASAEPIPRDERLRDPGREYMSVTDQMEHFKDCVWVEDQEKVWIGDRLLNQTKFDRRFGGHMFMLDALGQKKTASAWEAFTLSRALNPRRVDGMCFRPALPPNAIVESEGLTLLNTYVPIETRRIPGDVTPFLAFLRKLLPVERDRAIILAYMASLIQNPGKKFQWWPVIQGTEGNGKTLLLRCLMHAVGHRYTHLPNAPELARNGLKFNGWVTGNLLCGVEEISLGHKRDFLEEFKPIVTNDRVPIERKGVDQVTGDNFINGILMTNHQDGVPITVDTRRYAVFYTAQQSMEDKMADGMDGPYFAGLYGWLEADGYAIVAHYLANYAIPAELDPAGHCTEAPRTSAFRAAIRASMGRAEQEVMEAIDEGRVGFAGGWVSSLYLDRLMDSIRANVPRMKRKDMMRQLGYVWHPALNDGRVNAPVQPDNGKPKLYIREDHPAMGLSEPASVAKAYTAAQNEATQSATILAFSRAS